MPDIQIVTYLAGLARRGEIGCLAGILAKIKEFGLATLIGDPSGSNKLGLNGG